MSRTWQGERTWQGKLWNQSVQIEVTVSRGDDWKELDIARETSHGTQYPDTIEDRSPMGMLYDIWVARFPDKSEVLVEYWPANDKTTVAYRSTSFNSWGPPATLEEMVNQ